MYTFEYNVKKKEREEALGVKDPEYGDLEPQWVFLKAGKIVYQEAEPTDFEHRLKDEVMFSYAGNAGYTSYDRDAVFSVVKTSGPEGDCFVLTQIR